MQLLSDGLGKEKESMCIYVYIYTLYYLERMWGKESDTEQEAKPVGQFLNPGEEYTNNVWTSLSTFQ